MIGSYSAFNQDSIDSSQVYVGLNQNKAQVSKLRSPYDLTWEINPLKSNFKTLCRSLINIHRESCIMDDVSFILELLIEVFEKLKTECLRTGAISKTTFLPKISPSAISMKFSIQQSAIAIKAIEGLYNSLILFIEKYSKESFDLTSYLNMNRIGKAERLFSAVSEKVKKLEKFSYVLRFHSLGMVFVCAVRWIKKMRINLPKRANMTLELGEDDFREVNFPKSKAEDQGENQTIGDALFDGNQENQGEMWPASPINNSFTLDISLNSTITNFVSNIPKTLFTPSVSQRPNHK